MSVYDTDLPPLDPALIKHLDERFPERCPNPADSEREIWMKAGERRLVAWLVQKFQLQQDDPLNVHPRAPKIENPALAKTPDPAAPPPEPPVTVEDPIASKKSGRNSLRIDRTTVSPSLIGGSGLNI